MQTRGTFPELSSGQKKSSKPAPLVSRLIAEERQKRAEADKPTPRKASKSAPPSSGGGMSLSLGMRPRSLPKVPNTFAGRRAASHNRYGK